MPISLALKQPSLPDLCPITAAVEEMSAAGNIEGRGAVFTRREVVDFILDLCGYTADKPLYRQRLLEPSFGDGHFLLPAIDRLLAAWRTSGDKRDPLEALGDSVRAVELHRETFERTVESVRVRLEGEGVAANVAAAIGARWLVQGDFLLADLPGSFDYVVGNPPYVRQELISSVLLAEYRDRYVTMYDRADLYIPFIERSLKSLSAGGVLGFICADRWMKNRYGGPLRALVAEGFHLQAYVDMTDTPAFHVEVAAYPAITILSKDKAGPTRIAHRPPIDKIALSELSAAMTAARLPTSAQNKVREIASVAEGAEPWILDGSDQMPVLRRLEEQFPTLEETGCKVGIGVATGADKAFIGPFDALDVEDDRKLPLAMTRDIQTGRVEWRGYGVVNPFVEGSGSGLVALEDYPRLKRYLEERKEQIAARHVAMKAPASWYRTIDRITPSLASRPKLLIPDIKGDAQVVYEMGKLYPHHNLYFVTSECWELRALQAVLLSDVARLFVASYSTKLRGGFLRFQAQYLRRIRIPQWKDVSPLLRDRLSNAAEALDIKACNEATLDLYQMTGKERAALGGNCI